MPECSCDECMAERVEASGADPVEVMATFQRDGTLEAVIELVALLNGKSNHPRAHGALTALRLLQKELVSARTSEAMG